MLPAPRVLSTQDLADLSAVDEQLERAVLTNANVVVSHRQKGTAAAERAEAIGTEEVYEETVQVTEDRRQRRREPARRGPVRRAPQRVEDAPAGRDDLAGRPSRHRRVPGEDRAARARRSDTSTEMAATPAGTPPRPAVHAVERVDVVDDEVIDTPGVEVDHGLVDQVDDDEEDEAGGAGRRPTGPVRVVDVPFQAARAAWDEE